MTDKARELLERALEALEYPYLVDREDTLYPVMEEIRAYLADTNLSETINSQEVDSSKQDKLLDFCDTHCTWIDHHHDCPLKTKYRVESKK